MRRDDDRVGAHQQRVAVGRRLMNRRGGDDAIRARPVVHHHRGVPDHAQLVRNDAGQQVGGAARRKSDHDANRAIGKIGRGARGPVRPAASTSEHKQRPKA